MNEEIKEKLLDSSKERLGELGERRIRLDGMEESVGDKILERSERMDMELRMEEDVEEEEEDDEEYDDEEEEDEEEEEEEEEEKGRGGEEEEDEDVGDYEENPIPFSTSQKTIIPYSHRNKVYLLDPNDLPLSADQQTREKLEQLTLYINNHQNILPFNLKLGCCVRFVSNSSIILFMLIMLFINFYLSLGFLFNPVVIIMLLWFQWFVLGRLWIFQDAYYNRWKMQNLRKFLNRENENFFKAKSVELIGGDKGYWLEVFFRLEEEKAQKAFMETQKEVEVPPDSSIFNIEEPERK